MGFFKKTVSQEELGVSLYRASTQNLVQSPIKDVDGNEVLSVDEQKKIIASYMHSYLGMKNYDKAQISLIGAYITDTKGSLKEAEMMVAMVIALSDFKKVTDFFSSLPSNMQEFIKAGKSFFERKLNPIQWMLVLEWFNESTNKSVASLEQTLKRYKVK